MTRLGTDWRHGDSERLCEIFWQIPDDPRGSLRWSLSKLRNLVDDGQMKRIVADRENVAFDPANCDIDIVRFRETQAVGLDTLPTAKLAKLASISSHGFLQGLDLSGQPEFEHFLSSERESFRIMRRELLTMLIHRLQDSPGDAVRWMQELVEVEPYSVQAHLVLIETLNKVGRQKDAKRQMQHSLSVLSEIEGVDLSVLRSVAHSKPAASTGILLSPEETGQPAMHQEIRFCKASDGTQIAYASVGSGPPLVKAANWLNHLEFDWESPVWRHIFRSLSNDRALIRYDARGNGLSDWEVEDFSLERQVSDLESVVAAAKLDRFPLLGISQGCAISAEFAVRHPEKVTKLVLVGGYARGWNRMGVPDLVRQTEAMITLVGMGWGRDNPAFRQMFTSMFMPDAPPENQSWFNELQRITTTARNAVRLLRANGDVDMTDRLKEVRAPTLVLHARHDMRIPFDSGRELAGGIPGARFVSLDTSNHLMPETDPAWPTMLREISEFLSE
jgi:pimeloyl-ACP methyl ester carboxylesterase